MMVSHQTSRGMRIVSRITQSPSWRELTRGIRPLWRALPLPRQRRVGEPAIYAEDGPSGGAGVSSPGPARRPMTA
jgi:hypothetical protein